MWVREYCVCTSFYLCVRVFVYVFSNTTVAGLTLFAQRSLSYNGLSDCLKESALKMCVRLIASANLILGKNVLVNF